MKGHRLARMISAFKWLFFLNETIDSISCSGESFQRVLRHTGRNLLHSR